MFRFVSWNVPNLLFIEDDGGRAPTAFEQEDALSAVARWTPISGAAVVRCYAFGFNASTRHFRLNGNEGGDRGTLVPDTPLVANDDLFVALDTTIALASKYNVTLIIPFIDHWSYIGGTSEFAAMIHESSSGFFDNSSVRAAFKAVLRYILTRNNTVTGRRIADEPGIIWETGNELSSDGGGRVPADWTLDICRFVKSIVGQNQMIVDGSYSLYGWDDEVLQSKDVDMVTAHYYQLPFNPDRATFAGAIACLVLLLSSLCVLIWLCIRRHRCFCRRRRGDVPTAKTVAAYTILSLICATLLAILSYLIYKLIAPHLRPYADRFNDDIGRAASFNKTMYVGEFGLSSVSDMDGLLRGVVSSSALGALIWSLRFHANDGGLYCHSEGGGFFAYHLPGFGGDGGNCFGDDEESVVALMGRYAPALSPTGALNGTGLAPSPAPVLLSVDGGRLRWRGSAGASTYVIERAIGLNSDAWSVIAEVPDYARGSIGYRDRNFIKSTTIYYRIRAKNQYGTTDPSQFVQ